MRKSLTIIGLLLLVTISKAQVSLNHTFSNAQVTVINLNCTYYYFVDVASSQVTVYNEDYSLYKTCVFTPPSGYKLSSVTPSDNLFNSDNRLEFLVTFIKTTYTLYDNSYYTEKLYNEQGTVLYDFGTGAMVAIAPFKTTTGTSKLMLTRMLYTSSSTPTSYTNIEIYNISTNLTGVVQSVEKKALAVFPNPTNSVLNISIPYSIGSGENKTISIFNSNGQLVEKKQVDPTQNTLKVNVSNYSSGIYVYSYNGMSGQFIVE